MSRFHGNSAAVHRAVQIHHRSAQVARQNASRLLRPARAQVAELVREVVDVAPTADELQRLIDICSLDIEDPGLEFAEVRTEIREHTPFAGILRFLSDSQNRTEVWTVLSILVVILLHMLSQQQVTKVEIITPSVDEIVERVMEQIEHEQPPESPPITSPDCKEKLDRRLSF